MGDLGQPLPDRGIAARCQRWFDDRLAARQALAHAAGNVFALARQGIPYPARGQKLASGSPDRVGSKAKGRVGLGLG